MADEPNETSSSSAKSSTGKKRLPAISIPPRAAAEALFVGIKSPGPMTMLSNFFSDNLADGGSCGEVRSFSQLLAGAMASPSPTALGSWSLIFGDESSGEAAIAAGSSNPGNGDKLGSSSSSSVFKQNRPSSLMVPVSPLLAASPAFSPSVFLNSPSFFSPTLSPFGMSHQQALAQVTAQAVLNQGGYQAPSSVAEHIDPLTSYQSSAFNGHLPLSIKDEAVESVEDPHFDKIRTQNPPLAVGKPTNDGYNWRKYGQKQVKGSEFPRSYYRCTNSSCPVKKKVERSLDGHITEIIYKGQHNHEPPQKGKNVKEGASAKALAIAQQSDSQCSNGTSFPHSNLGGDEDSMQATSIQLNGPSDSEESGEGIQRIDEDDNDVEPKSKKRNIKAGTSDVALSHKTVTESKIIVQTRSEVDLLDDGYRWRKYGQKVVKGNPNPRSYYKCTTTGCGVRKHIERSHTDPKAVITTYEGKHIHDIPAGRGSKAKKCLKQLMDTATGSSAYD